jgi:hypothetical protein
MKMQVLSGTVALAAAVMVIGQMSVDAGDEPALAPNDDGAMQFIPTGGTPDVYVFAISGISNWEQGDHRAYSMGTTSCNIGSAPLAWVQTTSQHPVIAQNMYRYKLDGKGHGRFEQIGQSWLKHGFCALDLDACGDCQDTGCTSLGVGCSDPYTSSRNGSQHNAGPKYEVNATTGEFPFPPADPGWTGAVARRLQVPRVDVEAATNPGALYFFEAQYVHPEDNPASTPFSVSSNNVSYRQVVLADDGTAEDYEGDTVTQTAGIFAWRAIDPEVSVKRVTFSGEGVCRVAFRVYNNFDGTWDYEYAVHNLDLDRAIRSFSVPVPESVTVTDVGSNHPTWHSGEPYSNTPWASLRAAGELKWEAESFATDPNANAIRWGNLVNFRFTADGPPELAMSRLDVFKPGTPSFRTTNVLAPAAPVECPADVDFDLDVDFLDLLALLYDWGPCPACPTDLDGDLDVDLQDLLLVLDGWGPCE